jgi:hypothetical protein
MLDHLDGPRCRAIQVPLLKERTIQPCQGHAKLLLSSDVGP